MFPRLASCAFGNNKIRVSPVKMVNIDYVLQLEDFKKKNIKECRFSQNRNKRRGTNTETRRQGNAQPTEHKISTAQKN